MSHESNLKSGVLVYALGFMKPKISKMYVCNIPIIEIHRLIVHMELWN